MNKLVLIIIFLIPTNNFSQNSEEVIKADTIFLSGIGASFIKKNDTSAAYHLPCSSYVYVFGSKQYLYFTSCKFKDEEKPINKTISIKRLKESIVIDSNFIKKNGVKFWKSKLLLKKTFFLLHKSSDINEFTIEEVFYIGTSIPETGKDYIIKYVNEEKKLKCYDTQFFNLIFNYLLIEDAVKNVKIDFDFTLDSKILRNENLIKYFNVSEYEYLETIFDNFEKYQVCDIILNKSKDFEKKVLTKNNNLIVFYNFSEPLELNNNKILIFFDMKINNKEECRLIVIERSNSNNNFSIKDIIKV